jgi:hypothetical protein
MKERTWPYSLLTPDECRCPARLHYNVRKPDGRAVFSKPVPRNVAEEAKDALNERWDEVQP